MSGKMVNKVNTERSHSARVSYENSKSYSKSFDAAHTSKIDNVWNEWRQQDSTYCGLCLPFFTLYGYMIYWFSNGGMRKFNQCVSDLADFVINLPRKPTRLLPDLK